MIYAFAKPGSREAVPKKRKALVLAGAAALVISGVGGLLPSAAVFRLYDLQSTKTPHRREKREKREGRVGWGGVGGERAAGRATGVGRGRNMQAQRNTERPQSSRPLLPVP